MVYAIPKWDPDRGYRLAPYIWRAAERAIYAELESFVNNPLTDEALQLAVEYALQTDEMIRMMVREGRWSVDDVAKMPGVKHLARVLGQPFFLDETPYLDRPDTESWLAFLPAPESVGEVGFGTSLEGALEKRKEHEQQEQLRLLDMAFAAGGLSEREIEVLMRQHGIDFPYCETYEELGEAMDMTKSGARKLYIRALNKARAGAAELGD
jgi:DNA-directed RNA polymerase sigma subunit (sigma70/sigma32)